MKKPFKDPIAYKERKVSYNFAAPIKERATTGYFMSPGDDYGSGYKQPVGKFKASGLKEGPLKYKTQQFTCDEAIRE